ALFCVTKLLTKWRKQTKIGRIMQLQDNTFVITGGASGLGAATADYFVQQGANVVLIDVSEAVNAKAAELGEQALAVVCDITSASSAQAALDQALEKYGQLNGLVNCAGIGGAARIVGRSGPYDLDAFNRVIQVNLIGSFNMLRLAAAIMVNNEANEGGERGVIINTASVAAYDGQIGQAAYSASKGAIAALTLPAARDLAQHGIRVMTIAPGIFRTPMMAGMPQEVQDSLGASVPFPSRLGEPSEFAQLAGHIVANPMLNGEVIRLDGAIRMAPR